MRLPDSSIPLSAASATVRSECVFSEVTADGGVVKQPSGGAGVEPQVTTTATSGTDSGFS